MRARCRRIPIENNTGIADVKERQAASVGGLFHCRSSVQCRRALDSPDDDEPRILSGARKKIGGQLKFCKTVQSPSREPCSRINSLRMCGSGSAPITRPFRTTSSIEEP